MNAKRILEEIKETLVLEEDRGAVLALDEFILMHSCCVFDPAVSLR